MSQKKVILITGASSGIGLKAALDLAARGHIVYGGARRVDEMKPIVRAGGHALALDVTDETSMTDVITQIMDAEGRIDVLVNNAGYGLYGPVEEIPLSTARHQIEVNIFGLARMAQLVLPIMRQQKSGTIINMSSVGGAIYIPLGAWYHATKHAVEGFSDALRVETAQFGINVALICPGGIQTEFNSVLRDSLSKYANSGPYAKLAQGIIKSTDIKGSNPSVISNVIIKAVESDRPKTRYRAGKYSVILLILRRLLSDRMFDRVVMSFA